MVFSDGREIGPISLTAPVFSGRIGFRVFGWHEPQRGPGQMTAPFEAQAGRDLPIWRQPTAAMAHNPSQSREFPLPLKWQRMFRADRGAVARGSQLLFFEFIAGFLKSNV